MSVKRRLIGTPTNSVLTRTVLSISKEQNSELDRLSEIYNVSKSYLIRKGVDIVISRLNKLNHGKDLDVLESDRGTKENRCA